MKRILSILVVVSLLAAALPSASLAGGFRHAPRGGAVYVPAGHSHGGHGVGAFFAGLLGGAILSTVIHESRASAEYAPPREHIWVEGRYETRYERRWVPGHWEEERAYRDGGRDDRWDDDEDEDGSRRVWVPGRYREVPVKVWVEGHWEPRG